ncbi:MAG: nodulation protein NfeD [Acidobacteria bacterium]|nr:nodulation protein NfeD [Acidobacteriota bacterium]
MGTFRTLQWRLSAAGYCLLAALLVAICSPAPSAAQLPHVTEIHVDSMIHPISAEYVRAGIDQAIHKQSSLIVMQLSTPGGLDSSMRQMIEKIIASPVPVAVYVAPSGSRAASAGFFILLSADIAAMAPGTNTGAAHPVFMGSEPDQVMKDKVTNDAAAYLRSISSKRNRNPALAEKGVTESKSFTEGEALQSGLIDVVATNQADLLQKLDGREITRLDGRKQVLHLQGAVVELYPLSYRQMFLSRILDPNIAFILLIIGVLGLYMEFTNPGLILPGVAGGIALVLSLFALSLLPINWAGAALLFLAVMFFVLEAKFATQGILAAGGMLSMVLGALMLINTRLPGGSIRLSTALAVALPFGAISIFLLRLVIRSRALKIASGGSGLIGEIGSVYKPADTEGKLKVYVQGELWDAVSSEPAPPGARVRVKGRDGLTLTVEPTSINQSAAAPAGAPGETGKIRDDREHERAKGA